MSRSGRESGVGIRAIRPGPQTEPEILVIVSPQTFSSSPASTVPKARSVPGRPIRMPTPGRDLQMGKNLCFRFNFFRVASNQMRVNFDIYRLRRWWPFGKQWGRWARTFRRALHVDLLSRATAQRSAKTFKSNPTAHNTHATAHKILRLLLADRIWPGILN